MILLCAWLSFTSCDSGKRAFLMVQFCLDDAHDGAALKRAFQEIARREGLTYGDRSADTQREAEAIAEAAPEKWSQLQESFPIINIAVWNDGLYASAGNSGFPAGQVSVGFSEGSNPGASRVFAEKVIARLREEWTVHKVPPGKGAFPLKDCSRPNGPEVDWSS